MPGLVWHKSSFSGDDANRDCVEVAAGPRGVIHFRESDEPQVIATTTPALWAVFLAAVKKGTYDDCR